MTHNTVLSQYNYARKSFAGVIITFLRTQLSIKCIEQIVDVAKEHNYKLCSEIVIFRKVKANLLAVTVQTKGVRYPGFSETYFWEFS